MIVSVNGNRALDVNLVPEMVRGVEGSSVEVGVKKRSCAITCGCNGSGEHTLTIVRNPTSGKRPKKLLERMAV